MTKRPLQPKETALAAIRAGLLVPASETIYGVPEQIHKTQDAKRGSALATPPIRLPCEVGLQRIVPTPPAPSSKLLLRKKREAGNKKWIITRKQRPDLFP